MKRQSYSNHIRFYYPHHFIFYPACIILIGLSLKKFTESSSQNTEYLFFAMGFFLMAWLSFMMRQHYGLMVQNRIVRLELRLRYFQLTGKRFELIEDRISFGQLASLRFASDEELPGLTDRTLAENLSPDDIKKSIKNWQPDHMRI